MKFWSRVGGNVLVRRSSNIHILVCMQIHVHILIFDILQVVDTLLLNSVMCKDGLRRKSNSLYMWKKYCVVSFLKIKDIQ